MNKSQYMANYWLFGKDIETIDSRDFYELLGNETIEKKDTQCNVMPDCYMWQLSIDGWDYYFFSSHWTVGWEGDHDGDAYYCRVKCCTKAESEEMMKILTHQNVYEDDVAIGDDDFQLLH